MRTTIAHGKSRYQQKDSTLWGLASTWEMRLTGPIPRPERTLTITAIRLCLERILPPCKDRPIVVDLPNVTSVRDLKTAYALVVGDVASGDLTPDQGRALSDLLESYRRTIETSEIEQRLAMLEESMTSGSKRAPG